MIDRLPPQSLEAEQSVLGAILIDRDAVVEVAEFLRPADFYRQANGKIFEAVLELFERREPIDIVTVSEALERSERARGRRRPGLPLEPVELHADRRPRRPVRPDRRAQGRPPEPDRRGGADRRASATRTRPRSRRRSTGRRRSSSRSARSGSTSGSRSWIRSSTQAYDRLDYLHAHRGEISGVRTGFTDLDALTTGPPEERPDHPRGPAERREDELRPEHRRARRRPREEERRRLQPRDEQGAARPAPPLERRQHRQPAAPHRLPRGDGLRPHRAGDERPVRGARSTSTTRRTSARWSSGRRPAGSRPKPGSTS